MVKRITMDVHGYKVNFCDRGEVWLDDNDVLYFGSSLDVSMKWDGDNLVILPLTDDAGMICIGDGTTNMDVKIFGESTNSYIHWDNSLDTLYLNTLDIRFYNGDFHMGPGQHGKYIYFYDTNSYIVSVAGALRLASATRLDLFGPGIVTCHTYFQLLVTAVDSTAQGQLWMGTGSDLRWGHGAITFHALHLNATSGTGICEVNGGMKLTGAKLTLFCNNTISTTQGEIYVRSSDSTLRWGHGAIEFRALHASGTGLICTVPGHLRLNVDADSSTTFAGELWCESTTSKLRWGHGAIVFEAVAVNVASPKIECAAPIVLFKASGIGSLVTKGQLMYNTANNKLYFYDGTTNHQITSA